MNITLKLDNEIVEISLSSETDFKNAKIILQTLVGKSFNDYYDLLKHVMQTIENSPSYELDDNDVEDVEDAYELEAEDFLETYLKVTYDSEIPKIYSAKFDDSSYKQSNLLNV